LCLLTALFARALAQCNVKQLLNNIGSAAAAAPAAAASTSAAPASEAKNEEKKDEKKDESESEDEDMGFGKNIFWIVSSLFVISYHRQRSSAVLL